MSCTDDHLPGPHHVEDLWYNDGTLIIQAESSLFRVYKGILSSNSSVFCDMLSFPQPPHQELVEGCPLVRIPDSAVDTTYFLKALHHSSFFENGKKTNFGVLAGVLRLSTKYEVDYLRQRAITLLSGIFPTTLEAWDQRTVSPNPFQSFAALNLAREVNVLGILPAVMYSCSVSDIGAILDGITYKEHHAELNLDDKRTCLVAKANLTAAKYDKIYYFLRMRNEACQYSSRCSPTRLQWSNGIRLDSRVFEDFDWESLQPDVCISCFALSRNTHEDARQALWDDLPKIFNLPKWAELEATLPEDD